MFGVGLFLSYIFIQQRKDIKLISKDIYNIKNVYIS